MQVSVLEYLEESAGKYPDKTAVQDNKESFTYREYKEKAQIVGSGLSNLTTPGHSVVIYMQKKPSNLIAFMGAVYAGCYYTPIDNQMPLERVRLILDRLDPAVIIYDATTRDNLEDLGLMDRSVTYDSIVESELCPESLQKIRNEKCATDMLYVLFTSGSTGVPKGVTITEQAVIDCADWAVKALDLDESLRVCNQAPFYFDMSVLDIYTCLKAGGTLFLPPKTFFTFPARIIQYLNDNQINFVNWAPSAFCNVVNCNALDVSVPQYLKTVIFIGELMPSRHYNVWKKHVPDARFYNCYGPTEATYCCMYYLIDREFTDEEIIPLGKACENCRIVLLNEELKPAKPGELGEICIMGDCLSNGYFRSPEKTAEAFIQNPMNDMWTERMYKTGDLAYVDEAGDMIFAGRKDLQIKRLGYRIELGEIENAVLSVQGINNACCLYDQDTSDIIAVYTGEMDEEGILEHLMERIPNYMLPNRFIQLEEMPLNINGKIDRPLLKATYIK